jgi:hypothetical protein
VVVPSELRDLGETLALIKARISKHRSDKAFNEQNTKASLIVPVLQALGWDTNDSDEVHWEYKPKPKYNPVDFALLLQRTPCLFLEAKALRDSLRDDKLIAQVLTYSSVAGVQWAVLTNGDEYRIYNAGAPVPVEQKLFRAVSVANDDQALVLATLSLLSKSNFQDKKIGRLWASQFVDRQVKTALEELLHPEEPAKSMVRAIKKASGGRLRGTEILASLRRARLQLDFPEEPEAVASASQRRSPGSGRSKRTPSGPGATRQRTAIGVSLQALIAEGVLRAPAELSATYRGRELTATVNQDGTVTYGDQRFKSPSQAAGVARKVLYKGSMRLPATNGWVFWQVRDPDGTGHVPLGGLRGKLLLKRKAQVDRFVRKDA